jgi:kinesin family protein 11
MEETLSTLDYAMHAKSIRNKPEINQRMTRNALLKDYIAEIERLKSDILATREKNGIFFSQEHFEQMEAEKELRQSELAEAKKQADVIDSQLRAVREEFEQSIALLMRTDGELKETKATLQVREEDLQRKGAELEDTKAALEEEVIVRKAHASQEEVLHVIAKDLRKVVLESTNDVAGLFAKLGVCLRF